MSEPVHTPPPAPGLAFPPPIPTPPSFWGQNWRWIVGIGCLSVIMLAALCGLSGYIAVKKAMKTANFIVVAEQRAAANAAVQAQLGTPVKAGPPKMSSFNTYSGTNGSKTALDVTVPISGPKSSGTVHVVADVVNGKVTYKTMEATLPDGTKVDLRTDEERGATEPAGTTSA